MNDRATTGPKPLHGQMAAAADSRWIVLPVLLAGAFMVVLDFFIVNVALPSIAADLGAGHSSLEWIVAGYGLAFAAFLITAGRLGDELGRSRMYSALLVGGKEFVGVTSKPSRVRVADAGRDDGCCERSGARCERAGRSAVGGGRAS